jgi:hypothetical protein
MPPLTIPPDLSGPMHNGFRFYRHAPPATRFLALARSGTGWVPGWPRRLLRLASWRRAEIDVPFYFDLLSAGFTGYARPWRILVALAVVLRAWRTGHGAVTRAPIWSMPDTPPRRYGPTDSILRPSFYGSPPPGRDRHRKRHPYCPSRRRRVQRRAAHRAARVSNITEPV